MIERCKFEVSTGIGKFETKYGVFVHVSVRGQFCMTHHHQNEKTENFSC
jgi:hypothetical protein